MVSSCCVRSRVWLNFSAFFHFLILFLVGFISWAALCGLVWIMKDKKKQEKSGYWTHCILSVKELMSQCKTSVLVMIKTCPAAPLVWVWHTCVKPAQCFLGSLSHSSKSRWREIYGHKRVMSQPAPDWRCLKCWQSILKEAHLSVLCLCKSCCPIFPLHPVHLYTADLQLQHAWPLEYLIKNIFSSLNSLFSVCL